MSKKEKKEIENEVKEKTDAEDTTVVDDSNVDVEPQSKEDIEEKSTKDTKVDVVEEIADVVEPKIEEPTELADPFSSWETVFSEFNKEAPVEEPIEWLNRDEIRMVAREEIKGWVKGIHEGKYPLPMGMAPKIEPIVEETSKPKNEVEVGPFSTKEFEALQGEIVDIKKSRDESSTKLEEVMKSLDAMKKEIEVIRDTPIDLVEKSMKKESPYEAKIDISRDGQITRRK